MKIFFDFDDVLFNTGAFVEAVGDIFTRQGISLEAFHATYAQARSVGNNVVKVYNFDTHIDILRQQYPEIDKEALRLGYDALFADTRPYVFPDVIPTFETLRKMGMEVFVVSFGIDKIQRGKIAGSGLMPFLADAFVGIDAKSAMIVSALGDDTKGWFIDDQPKFIGDVKTVFPFMQTIQMMRKDGRFTNEIHPKSDFVAENMREVMGFVIHST